MAPARTDGDAMTPKEKPGEPSWPAGRTVAVTLTVVTVLALLAGVAAMVVPRVAGASQDGDRETRQAVLTRSSDFVTAFNTYSTDGLQDYQDRVGGLLTDDFRKEFDDASKGYLTGLRKKKQTSGDATVLGAAVDAIDDDSAEVIIAVDASVKNTDTRKPIARHFRWRVSLERVGESWKVSKYTPVSTEAGKAPTSGKGAK